ncbi:MAG: T9SS type A sorting domain-containing protein [Calditrichaeota bacterium]|nr:T9SS type A sorting domain-containing protein [Calditrichota bacterium]
MTRPFLSVFIVLLVAISYSTAVGSDLLRVDDHASILSSGASGVNLEFSIDFIESESVLIDGEDFKAIRIPGEGALLKYGKPILPMVCRFVVVHPDMGVALDFSVGSRRRERAESPPKLYLEEGAITGPQNIDLGVKEIFPPHVAEISEPFIIRGARIVKVTTYPLQYDPVNDEYIHNEQIRTSIVYTDEEPINPVEVPTRRNRSQVFLKFIRDYAINGDIVGRDDPDRDETNPYLGHYLIVTHENCLEYLGEFIEWKRKSGYKVDILIAAEPTNANTTWDQIRDRYNEYLNQGTDPFDYLLIVGDLDNLERLDVDGQWMLIPPVGRSTWPLDNPHGDYYFGCLNGNNDQYADVGIGRWPSGSVERLGIASGRTMLYEATPNMEDEEWFERAASFSQHWGNGPTTAWHITIHTNVRWGEEVLKYCGYDDIRFFERYQYDQMGQVIGPWVRDIYNEGASVFLGRAENYFWRYNFNGVNENTRFPIRLVASGHGEWNAWNSFMGLPDGSAENLKGPVATTFGWGTPPTALWSAVWMETVRNVMLQDMSLGWGFSGAIMAVERYFPNENWANNRTNYYDCVRTDYNCYGDPGIQPWFGMPRRVEATFPELITSETRMIEVNVTGQNDEPIQGALVSFYVPGDIPDFDNENYRDYDDMFMMTTISHEDGNAIFVFDEDIDFDGDEAFITITGRDICPFFGDVGIERNISSVELADYSLTEIDGNENDEINPGEVFNISLTAVNLGNQNVLEAVTAIVSSTSPWIEVPENEISFGDIPAGESADGEEPAILVIHANCPDGMSRPGTRPVINITFSSGDQTFESAIKITPSAPNFQIRSIIGGIRISTEEQELDIDIENIGRLNASPVVANLISDEMGISVIQGDANYPAIEAEDHSRVQGNPFVISGNNITIPGSKHQLLMTLTTEGGFVDSVHFELQVDEPREGAPQGPDGYGYICFDNTDQDWDIAPDYDWVEINPTDDDAEFDGIECDFNGRSEFDTGEAQVVEMGLNTQFYGNLYDQITISTNGFISMGSQPLITNLQNWPMDRVMGGGVGMVAPFWDWLEMTENSKVLYYHDEENSRFIVEWYRFRHHSGGETDLNFQVIFYDNEVWITESGDQNILFQYKTISNVRGQSDGQTRESNNYFASVGISNPNGSSGISYTWNNDYPVTSAELANRRAILFGTSIRFRSCVLLGVVTDAETGDPIEDAVVSTEHGFIAMTNEDGNWVISNALAEMSFQIEASAQGYNDLTFGDFEVEENDTLEINFEMLHPEFIPSVENLGSELPIDGSIELEFTISNTGNGPLSWSAMGELRGDANADPWDLRRQYPAGEVIQDSRIQGVVYIDDQFYVAGANNRNPKIYILNQEGELLDQFGQFDRVGSYGYKDLAFDGELIWGSGAGTIHGFTPDGELVHDFEGPFNPNNNFAWDTDREILWVSSTTSNIIGIDREGNVIDELNRNSLRIYGLAYWPDDPDGYQLYIFNKINNVANQVIHKMNVDNGDTMLVRILEPDEGGFPIGACISNQLDVYSWVFIGVINDRASDRIDIWQIDTRRGWFNLDPLTGVIEAGEAQDYILTLDATGLPTETLFEADIQFQHNAMENEWTLPISLEVIDGLRAIRLDLVEPWNIVSINVQPEVDDIIEMLSPLVEADQLIIAKNRDGQFYLPQQNFNNIDFWDVSEGYQIKVTEPVGIQFMGVPIEPDQPIQLRERWNMIAYFPRQPVDAVVALSGIEEVIEIAKDGNGNFYIPVHGFSNMGDMREGLGYQVKLTEETELIYQIGERVAADLSVKRPEHFNSPKQTDNNMSMLVFGTSAHRGMELGVYSPSGKLIGSGKFDDSGRCGLAVWGDDLLTDKVEGAVSGDELSFRLWNGSEESNVLIAQVAGHRQWQKDGYLVAELLDDAATLISFGIHKAFPNPTNGPVKLVYGVEVDAKVSLKIYDLNGRLAKTLVNQEMKTGYYQVTWDTDVFSSGLYLVRLETEGRSHISKVAVLK